MHVLNVTDLYTTNEYDKLLDLNTTDDYNITDKCTIKENIIDIIIPTLLLTIPCGLSFLCLMSLIVYTLNKLLFNKK